MTIREPARDSTERSEPMKMDELELVSSFRIINQERAREKESFRFVFCPVSDWHAREMAADRYFLF